MSVLLNKLEHAFNDQLLYAVFKLLKMKGSWFVSNHSELLRVMDGLLDRELIAKSRGMIGKVLGLLLKQNPSAVEIIQKRTPKFEGEEIAFQNNLYYYLISSVQMIKKAQDLRAIQSTEFGLLDFAK